MASCKNNRILKSVGQYRSAPQHVVFLAMVMSLCVNADKSKEGNVGDKAALLSSSNQASNVVSLGVGAQGYIESVNGIVTLTMSNQEASMGVISDISVSEGQSVQKGDVLVVSSHYKIRENQKIVAELEYSLAKTELEISKN